MFQNSLKLLFFINKLGFFKRKLKMLLSLKRSIFCSRIRPVDQSDLQTDPDPAGQEGEGADLHLDRREGNAKEERVCHAGKNLGSFVKNKMCFVTLKLSILIELLWFM